jgi:hypothetical protein
MFTHVPPARRTICQLVAAVSYSHSLSLLQQEHSMVFVFPVATPCGLSELTVSIFSAEDGNSMFL